MPGLPQSQTAAMEAVFGSTVPGTNSVTVSVNVVLGSSDADFPSSNTSTDARFPSVHATAKRRSVQARASVLVKDMVNVVIAGVLFAALPTETLVTTPVTLALPVPRAHDNGSASALLETRQIPRINERM